MTNLERRCRWACSIVAAGVIAGCGMVGKTVASKEAPNVLVANDGTFCVVSEERFAKTEVGMKALCAWRGSRIPEPRRSAQPASAAPPADTIGYTADVCASCAEWNAPTKPLRLHGNTYYVGTHGLTALLITSPDGHVLIDGGLPNSAPQIVRSIRALGFREQDVKLILNSHVHYDHAGGLAALQRMTGSVVAASRKSAPVLRTGSAGTDDPQYGMLFPMAPVARVHVFDDGDTMRVGNLALVAQLTPGHTPGGTSWTWRSCDGARCLNFVYGDSQTAVSADSFYFSRNSTYPNVLQDFEKSFKTLESLECDVLITPHPAASNMWQRSAGANGAQLVDARACARYAQKSRQALAQRVARENQR